MPFESACPVRRFRSRKGQRHLSGLWWSATTSGHVGFESWVERDHDMTLDFDAAVGHRVPAVLSATGACSMRRTFLLGAQTVRRWWSTAGRWSVADPMMWPSSKRPLGRAPWLGGSTGGWSVLLMRS